MFVKILCHFSLFGFYSALKQIKGFVKGATLDTQKLWICEFYNSFFCALLFQIPIRTQRGWCLSELTKY